MARREPKWLTREQIEAIHDLLLGQHGGLPGIRDAGALESAIGRPRNKWQYRENADLAVCAAAYGFRLARNHAFTDGNKRTALVAMGTFLARNGLVLNAPEPAAVTTMIAVAAGSMSEPKLAEWLRENTVRAPRRK